MSLTKLPTVLINLVFEYINLSTVEKILNKENETSVLLSLFILKQTKDIQKLQFMIK